MDRFGFPEDHFVQLLDRQATQARIRAAFDQIAGRVGTGDVVVCFYSGHGSTMPHPERPEETVETIVPHDSGRGAHPNRDIPDFAIDRWIQRLNEKTPYVTLIFDCCFSGTLTRDPFAAKVRQLEADSRPPEQRFGAGTVPELFRDRGGRPVAAGGPFAYVPGRHRAAVIAACRSDEEAAEIRHGYYTYGALSHFLCRALEGAGRGVSWRDVFEKVGPQVTGKVRQQHPQIEGSWDDVVFGTRESLPDPYLKVTGTAADTIELSGGAAHGVTVDSEWSVHPHGSRSAATAEELARVRIETVAAISAAARVREAGDTGRLEAGQRAFLRVQRLREPGLAIRLEVVTERAGALRALIEKSPLLVEAAEEEPADVLVRYLEPRRVVKGKPCPSLGSLEHPTWAAVGQDGRLAVRTQRARADLAAVNNLVGDLERIIRYRDVLAIENPDPASRLGERVRMVFWRRGGRQPYVLAEPESGDGLLAFEEEELLEVEVRNEHSAKVWITLLLFNCDRSIERLVPRPGHTTYRPYGYPLEPGKTLKVEDYLRRHPDFRRWPGLHFILPKGFPWAAEPGENPASGLDYLKLMVTPEQADFEFVEQKSALGLLNFRDPGPQSHPLLQLARLYACGEGKRSLPLPSAGSASLDWAALTRPLAIRRRRGQGGPGR